MCKRTGGAAAFHVQESGQKSGEMLIVVVRSYSLSPLLLLALISFIYIALFFALKQTA